MSEENSVQFGQFNRNPLGERIVERLLKLIQEKQLKPGDRLPPERELAALMQVSRPSLREALRTLSFMNVVEVRPGSGTYITSLETELLVEHLEFAVFLDDSTFMQLFETRKILEVGIIALSASKITDEEIAKLEACLQEAQQVMDDAEAFMREDIKLHKIIVQACHNPILLRFMESINRLGEASRKRTTQIPGVVEQVMEDHRAIVQALKKRDPEAARAAMLAHLNNVDTRLKSLEDDKEQMENT